MIIQLKDINTASQRTDGLLMILITKRKFFPIQQYQVRCINDMRSVYCTVRTESL
jgi:hypothetical protein